MKQCGHSSIVIKSVQNVLCPPSHTHTDELALSNCSTDDLVVKSGPLLHESLNEVVDVTDSRAIGYRRAPAACHRMHSPPG